MKKILIIEDDITLSLTLGDNLSHEGFEIVRAKDGEEGLAAALSSKPDLILLDILLPKMDGLTLLNKLREDGWGKYVPVIILSNLSASTNVSSALSNDVHQYLVKIDWKIEDVIKKVREELGMEK